MSVQKLIRSLRNREYRRQFVSGQTRHIVSAQIKALRESRSWKQSELGKRAGMKANAISRLENPNYGDFTVNTLLRIADAFDVGLIVRFAPFSELVEWNQSVSLAAYVPQNFENDRRVLTITQVDLPALRADTVQQDVFYRPDHVPCFTKPASATEIVDVTAPEFWELSAQSASYLQTNVTIGQGGYDA